MKKTNKKGFTLIELLAVIIILGILMIIAVPAVQTYITNSRKSTYVNTASKFVSAVTTEAPTGKAMNFNSPDTLYLVPVGDKMLGGTGENAGNSCIGLDSGGQSPFGDEWTYAYVGVTTDGKTFHYYFISQDSDGYGLDFMTEKTMKNEGEDLLYTTPNDSGKTAGSNQENTAAGSTSDIRTFFTNQYKSGTNKVITPGSAGEGITTDYFAKLQKIIAKSDSTPKTTVVIYGACKTTE